MCSICIYAVITNRCWYMYIFVYMCTDSVQGFVLFERDRRYTRILGSLGDRTRKPCFVSRVIDWWESERVYEGRYRARAKNEGRARVGWFARVVRRSVRNWARGALLSRGEPRSPVTVLLALRISPPPPTLRHPTATRFCDPTHPRLVRLFETNRLLAFTVYSIHNVDAFLYTRKMR